MPGGSRAGTQFDDQSLIVDLIGIDLPEKEVSDFLLETYFASVHWFMMVFHEPTFMNRYKEMIVSRRAHRSQLRQISLLLLVLAMGARYATKADVEARSLSVSLKDLQLTLLEKVQESLMEIFDEGELESVQICILLSSFHLYHGKPNLGFIILGTGVRCAQAMGLHKESTWRVNSPLVREERKRVWWALYVFDR